MLLTRIATRPYAFLIATILFVMLTGCQALLPAPTSVIPPTDADGQACAAACALPHEQCEQRQRLREDQCQQDAEQISAEYAACSANKGRQCLQPVPCLGAEMQVCKTQFDECILACGGRTELGPRTWSWPLAWPWSNQDKAVPAAAPEPELEAAPEPAQSNLS